MSVLWKILGRDRHGRMVRPWALLGPVVVLLITLPMLRPLLHPDPRTISDEELSRLATVQALVEHGTLAIDQTDFVSTHLKVRRDGHFYSDQPPVMSVLLAPTYWVMSHAGITFAKRPDLVMYLLTLLGVTIPVAGVAGLVYRMGRLFELARPWRAALGLVVALASGLVSYATVLNPHAPAAALVLCAAASLIHLSITSKRAHGSIWLVVSGLCAALAATIDPPAIVFVLLLPAVVFTLRWSVVQRFGGLAVFLLGAALPLVLHGSLSSSIPGSGFRVYGPAGNDSLFSFLNPDSRTIGPAYDNYVFDDEEPQGAWDRLGVVSERLVAALVGEHGLLSHFPVVLLGLAGVSMVMHRHWPGATKMLASVTLGGSVLLIVLFVVRRPDWHGAMFASRWFVVFVPITVFWAGAWLRRDHHKIIWAAAGVLLTFSLAVSLIGATGPLPRNGFIAADGSERYTLTGALENLVDRPPTPATTPGLAGG